MQKKHLIAYPATALIALGIGASGGGDSTGSAAARPTVTTTVAGESTSEPAVTVTATPTVKVTETAPAPEAQTAMSRGRHLRGRRRRPAGHLRLGSHLRHQLLLGAIDGLRRPRLHHRQRQHHGAGRGDDQEVGQVLHQQRVQRLEAPLTLQAARGAWVWRGQAPRASALIAER
jgi:hypothetical protein